MAENTETIKDKNGGTVAIIIYKDYCKEGIEFFTPADFSQQLAFLSHKTGKVIQAHTHNIVKRDIRLTQETLVIKKGKVKFNFYDGNNDYFDSRILGAGDVILLSSGGHGLEILEDTDMVEIKQGPYLSDDDKTRFKGIEEI